jgi:prepilin-type processing-associated H-X9-DG protein
MTEKYNDLIGVTNSNIDGSFSCGIDTLGPEPGTNPDGSLIVTPGRLMAGAFTGTFASPWGISYTGGTPTTPGSPERMGIITNLIYTPGYNSNYVASWWLVRSGVKLDANGNLVDGRITYKNPGCTAPSNKERASTTGPLTRRLVDNAGVSASLVPMLGDTAEGDIREAVLSTSVGDIEAGERLGEAFTDGPVLLVNGTYGTAFNPPVFPTGTVFATWWNVWSKQTLQDYRDFGPIHGSRQKSCNMLMADGSVRSFIDTDNDGFLNNGFPASATAGFKSDELELLPKEIMNTYSLKVDTKGNLDRQ